MKARNTQIDGDQARSHKKFVPPTQPIPAGSELRRILAERSARLAHRSRQKTLATDLGLDLKPPVTRRTT
jgi:hypothetical protein